MANGPLSLSTIELQAQKTGSERHSTFFRKFRNVVMNFALIILAVWLIASYYNDISNWVQSSIETVGSETKTKKSSALSDYIKERDMIFEVIGFDGKWTTEEDCDPRTTKFCLVVLEDQSPHRVNFFGKTTCYKPTDTDLLSQVKLVDGGWTGFQPYLKTPLGVATEVELLAPFAGKEGRGPTLVYVVSLPTDLLSDCTRNGNRIMKYIWQTL